MKTDKTTLYRAALKAGVATAMLAVTAPAVAQEVAQAEMAETIIVTGSRIARPDLEASSPVAVIGAQEFQLSGAVNVEEVIYDLPQVIPALTAASNNPGEGVATVDLRGLGATRTLVLVNGRRYVSYDEQQIVDLNTVPAALIERVDVVTGGRSAVYGSDAIAGVVNFVLKKDFEGAQLNTSYRLTGKGDGDTWTVDGLLGGNFAGGKGNATVYMSYSKRKAIMQGDRSFSSYTLGDIGDGTTYFGGSGSILGTRLAVRGLAQALGYAGATPTSSIKFGDGAAPSLYDSTTDQYNYAPVNYLQTPNERWFLGGFAHYEINEHFEAFAEAQFINSRADTQLAPTPVTGTYNFAIDNPYLTPEVQAAMATLDTDNDGYVSGSIGRRFAEGGARQQRDDRLAYRALVGLRGEIVNDWAYEGYYSYARNRDVQNQEGNVMVSRFRQAIDVVADPDAPGGVRCRNTANGCQPLNIFGPGSALPEAAAWVTVPTSNQNEIVEQVASFSVNNGNLFDLGAGPAGIALGAEWRSETGSYRPDFALASGDVVGFNAGEPTNGHYSVTELFGEFALPLLADMPFAEKLELNGAVRYSDYSNAVGSTWAYSIGGQYTPVQDVTLRAQYQRAVRAPTISQLFLGSSVGFPSASDPCEQEVALTNANLNATCLAQGIPAASIGTEFAGGNSQIQSRFGGNPDLTEETADTYTIGAILQPRFAPRLSITVDYYNITVKDYIGSSGPGTQNVIAACYGDSNSNYVPYDSSFCDRAPRDPDSLELIDVVSTNENLGKLKTSGIDFEARYSFDVGFGMESEGRLDLRFTGSYLMNWKLLPIASAPGLVNECDGKFGNTCGDPYSKWRWSTRVTYSTGPLTASLLWRHIGSAKDDDDASLYYREKFGAVDYFDLAASYQVNEVLDFTVGIDNLFDKKPPLAGDNQQQSNTFPSTYDVFGRRFFFSASAKF